MWVKTSLTEKAIKKAGEKLAKKAGEKFAKTAKDYRKKQTDRVFDKVKPKWAKKGYFDRKDPVARASKELKKVKKSGLGKYAADKAREYSQNVRKHKF